MALTQDQINEFFEVGYLCVPGVFTADEVEIISEALDRLKEMAAKIHSTQIYKGAQFVVEGTRIDRIVWCGAAEPILLKMSEKPKILKPVSQLLHSNTMEQLICQTHLKIPGDTVAFPWHQDSQHRGYGTKDWKDVNGQGSYVQTMLAIDEITLNNGPVYMIPGSHKKGHLGLQDIDDPSTVVDLKKAVPILMKPGDLCFFGPYVVHGSEPNDSDLPRRVFINGYAYPGANKKLYPGEGSGRTLCVA